MLCSPNHPKRKRATPCESKRPSSFSHSACARQSRLSRRFDCSQSFLTYRLTSFGNPLFEFVVTFAPPSQCARSDSGDNGRAAYRSSIGGASRSRWNPPELCERAWTCLNMGSVVMQRRYVLALRRRHTRETVREGFEPSGDKDSTKVVFFACSGVFPARHLLRTAGMAESLF